MRPDIPDRQIVTDTYFRKHTAHHSPLCGIVRNVTPAHEIARLLGGDQSFGEGERIIRPFRDAGKIVRCQRRFSLHLDAGGERLGIEQEAFG